MGKYYILIGDEVREVNFAEWVAGYESLRHVARDQVGDVLVSTVFLGIDHRFGGSGPPILFETMIFGGEFDEEQVRYCTIDEARRGHEELLRKVQGEDLKEEKSWIDSWEGR